MSEEPEIYRRRIKPGEALHSIGPTIVQSAAKKSPVENTELMRELIESYGDLTRLLIMSNVTYNDRVSALNKATKALEMAKKELENEQ